jgi:hypothetical protein
MRGALFLSCVRIRWLLALCLIVGSRSLAAGNVKPSPAKTPLSPEQIAIYRVFFDCYAGRNPDAANLAAQTVPLDPSAENSCMKGIALQNLAEAGQTSHRLEPQITEGTKLRLSDAKQPLAKVKSTDPGHTIRKGKPVDDAARDAFAAGLLSISEIAFDENHRHAFMSYGFYCGDLCGPGGNLVFERFGESWKLNNAVCGGWIS